MQLLAIFQPPNLKILVPNPAFSYFLAAKRKIMGSKCSFFNLTLQTAQNASFWTISVNSWGGVLARGGLKYPPSRIAQTCPKWSVLGRLERQIEILKFGCPGGILTTARVEGNSWNSWIMLIFPRKIRYLRNRGSATPVVGGRGA